MGPSLNLVLRRTQLGSSSLFKQATRQPEQTKVCAHNIPLHYFLY